MNIEQAKRISLVSLLESAGHPVVRRRDDQLWYRSPLRSEKTPSFKVTPSRNLWYDFGLGKGGDVITFVQEMYRLPDVAAALARMDELAGGAKLTVQPQATQDTAPPSGHRQSQASALQITDVRPIQHTTLLQYLDQRRIALDLASCYLSEVQYRRGNRSYLALGMPNDTGLKTGAAFEVRNAHFKGTIGPKDIRTVPGTSKRVSLYEGMFDFLSHLNMSGKHESEATSIILNSVGMKDKAVERIRELQPTGIDLYLDHDDAGRRLVAEFTSALPGFDVHDGSGFYADWKDLGDFHTAQSVLSRLSDWRPSGPTTSPSRRPDLRI